MKIKEGFILRKISDTYVVVAVGEAAKDFKGMVTLNETGGFLWEKLSEGATEEQLVDALLENYDVDKALASTDVKAFIAKLSDNNLLD